MKVRGVSHFAIATRDMERSLHFYCDILGLKIVRDIPRHASVDQPDGQPQGKRVGRLVYLAWDSGAYIPFITLQQHEEPLGARAVPVNHVGLNHIGIWVEDFEETAAKLKAAGVPFIFPPTITDGSAYPGGQGRVGSFMCRDPDGTVIQIDHRIE
jgi:catechol 2,3-dioxygenase-like lactoylglutathione lyase family enzyme